MTARQRVMNYCTDRAEAAYADGDIEEATSFLGIHSAIENLSESEYDDLGERESAHA